MRMLVRLALPAVALMLAGDAFAQSNDEYCAQRVAEVCGDNQSIGDCFQDQRMWSSVGSECQGAVQTLIENEREATEQQQSDSSISAVNLYGFSYGGVLRAGPTMDAAKVASIQKGDEVEVLEDPGVWMNGYKWFKVRTPHGTGYHWGGIFCITGDTLPEGVFDNCQFMNQ